MTKKTHQHSFKCGDKTNSILRELMAQNDEASKNMVITDALRFAHANGMYTKGRGDIASGSVTINNMPPTKKKKDGGHPLVAHFNDLGCFVDQYGIVHYTKYEKIPTGRIVRNTRAHPVRELPEDFLVLSRQILGPFSSLIEAEQAYEAQSDEKQDRGLNRDDSIKL